MIAFHHLNILAATVTHRIGTRRCTDLPLRISLKKAVPAFMDLTDLESDGLNQDLFTSSPAFYTTSTPCANQIPLFVYNSDTY
jgi:hypothetical protein